MADRDKVVECLTDIEQIMIARQEICPREELQYWIELQEGIADALALLKEQNGLILALEQSKAVNEHLNALLKEQEKEIDEIADEYLDIGREMAKQPKIIRCKDCKHFSDPDGKGFGVCMRIMHGCQSWGFCADGERRESNDL